MFHFLGNWWSRIRANYDVSQWLYNWRCLVLTCIMTLLVITAVITSVVLLTHTSEGQSTNVFPKIPETPVDANSSVRFVSRREWGAQPPTESLDELKQPVPYVIISHTATDFCYTQSTCTLHVRYIQTFHIESKNWSDIAYNFLVGGDGLAYVGRSWNFVGAHTFGYNSKSIGISFIGTFNTALPSKSQLNAAKRVIEIGVDEGVIDKNYKLIAHRQVSPTLSPGDALYAEIQTWPHWTPNKEIQP